MIPTRRSVRVIASWIALSARSLRSSGVCRLIQAIATANNHIEAAIWLKAFDGDLKVQRALAHRKAQCFGILRVGSSSDTVTSARRSAAPAVGRAEPAHRW